MRLSTRGQYAVRAILDLACNSNGKPVNLMCISKREGISINYLEQLFFRLRKGKIVKSIRGPGGGYVLALPMDKIRIGKIIEVVEEPLNPVACLDKGKKICNRKNRCVTIIVWKGLADKIREFLNSITLKDLMDFAKREI